ncbi:DUF5610 domain-containing protein [Neptunicella sp.]|uniref:DUF5610 domain-containing protein n=1 Tax=Neptunicella sp. TaxID=2125986 RepID=UPI003F68CE09
MNIGDLKAFLGNKTHMSGRASHSNDAVPFDNNKQAVGKQGNHVSLTNSAMFSISSQTFIGARVYNHSLNQNLVIHDQKANLPSPKNEQEKGLFDFEEVAKNVLSFVGGALKNAKSKGMSDEALNSMFEQARSGVLKGVNMAKKDLGDMMNNEITDGISKSQDLIEQGIKSLEQQIFGKQPDNQVGSNTDKLAINQQVNYTEQQSGQLTIRTRDGDEVSISFEDARQFSLNQQILLETQQKQKEQQQDADKQANRSNNEDKQNIRTAADAVATAPSASDQVARPAGDTSTTPDPDNAPVDIDNSATQATESQDNPDGAQSPEQTQSQVTSETNYQHYESNKLSYSVKGELDDEELKAIGELVGDAGKLADEFFYGDIDKAFNQALDLGYDDQELTGFALQLTSFKQTEVIKTYGAVSHYNDQNEGNVQDSVKAAKPVADYLEHMLDVVDKAQARLQDGNSFDGLINGIINNMPEVHTPDLIEAINRFKGFNQRLMDNLPQRQS